MKTKFQDLSTKADFLYGGWNLNTIVHEKTPDKRIFYGRWFKLKGIKHLHLETQLSFAHKKLWLSVWSNTYTTRVYQNTI